MNNIDVNDIIAEYQDQEKVDRVQAACEFNYQRWFHEVKWSQHEHEAARKFYLALYNGTRLSKAAATRITECYFSQVVENVGK